LIPIQKLGKISYYFLLEFIMIKKVLITLALVIPTVFLCTVLIMNQSHIGSNKEFTKKEYVVEGMTCKNCELKLKQILNGKYVSVESVDFKTKVIILHLDPLKMSLSLLNESLLEDNYVLKLPEKKSLEVLDYQIRFN